VLGQESNPGLKEWQAAALIIELRPTPIELRLTPVKLRLTPAEHRLIPVEHRLTSF